jgi:hypothetical protein
LQKYDNRIVLFDCGEALRASAPGTSDEESLARPSRLTADDRRSPLPTVAGTLTPLVAQNNSEIDGLGFHSVNFASADFSIDHLLIRPEGHSSSRGVARR